MYKIATLNNISPKGLAKFSDQYEITPETNDADGILVRSFKMHDMEFSPNLKAIARAGAGVNNIPLDKCAEQGIVVFNTPGANANAVKELVLGAMFLAARDIVGGINWVNGIESEGIADAVEKGKSNFAGTEIKGKTLGVVGLGAIGVMVANAAEMLGMSVIGYDPFISVNSALNLSSNVKLNNNIDALISQCDYISLHIPANANTKGMFGVSQFALMKQGVKVLNFSRDSIIDSAALEAALESGKVSCYVTDFPVPSTHKLKNTINIPHLGASSEESEENCAMMAAEEISEYLENGNIINSVNFPACDLGQCNDNGRIAIIHKTASNSLANITAACDGLKVTIHDMITKSKGDYSYTLIDIDSSIDAETASKINFEGVISVRVVK